MNPNLPKDESELDPGLVKISLLNFPHVMTQNIKNAALYKIEFRVKRSEDGHIRSLRCIRVLGHIEHFHFEMIFSRYRL